MIYQCRRDHESEERRGISDLLFWIPADTEEEVVPLPPSGLSVMR